MKKRTTCTQSRDAPYSETLRGLPPAFVLRLAASSRKCSLPYFRAVALPPMCPIAVAAGIFAWLMRSSVRASAARSNSRERPVRFWGRSGVVSRIRSTSEIKFFRAWSEDLSVGILPSCGQMARKASVRCFRFNALLRHYPRSPALHRSANIE